MQVLHLAALALQVCGVILQRELIRARRLDENCRKLKKGYEALKDSYEAFHEEVESKTRRRLVRKGVGVALSFIPGLGLIDILSDLGDVLDVATEVGEEISELDMELTHVPEPVEVFGDAGDSESEIPIGEAAFLPLIPNAQIGVKEVLLENVDPENTTPDPSDLDNFFRDTLQRMEDLIQSWTEDKRREAIVEIITNLREFDYQLRYPISTSKDQHRRKSK